MISLIIIIVVLLIVASVTLKFTKDLLYESTLKNTVTNMLLVQARAEMIYDKSQFDENTKLVGANVDVTEQAFENEYKTAGSFTINNVSMQDYESTYVNYGIEDITELQVKTETKEEDGETKTVTTPSKWYKWENKDYENSAKAELEDLKIDLKDNEYYLVNYETGEVVLSKGYKKLNENAVLFKLSELDELQKSGGK